MAGLNFNDRDYYAGDDQGYYQHILLTDIINNFMVSEVGEGMLIPHISETIVQFHAQRAVQELSFETLRSVKSYEFALEGSPSVVLPQDGVGVVGVSWVDDSGYKHPMNERIYSGNPQTPLENEDGEFLYDNDGNLLFAENSVTLARFDNRTQSVASDAFYNYYAGSFENDELYDRYYSYYGRRFGSDPTQTNINGTYWYDESQARVFVDAVYTNQILIIDYVTDGLGEDVSLIRVHKFAEDAVYNYIRYKIVSKMLNIPLYEKQLVKKEYVSTKRRAKHRLSKISFQDIFLAVKGKQKWIKH